jgi:hypothetical protein
VATNRTKKTAAVRTSTSDGADPPARLRLKLNTMDDVKRELARLYREGKAGSRDVVDVSRLANVLSIMGRLIEGSEFEARLAALESDHGKT